MKRRARNGAKPSPKVPALPGEKSAALLPGAVIKAPEARPLLVLDAHNYKPGPPPWDAALAGAFGADTLPSEPVRITTAHPVTGPLVAHHELEDVPPVLRPVDNADRELAALREGFASVDTGQFSKRKEEKGEP